MLLSKADSVFEKLTVASYVTRRFINMFIDALDFFES
jgi:hypothetical protein